MRKARLALALLVAVLTIIPAAHPLAAPRGERSVDVWMVAVTEEGGGQLFRARITIYYPGSGSFEVKPSFFVGSDTEASFRLAAALACIVAGVDPSSIDITVTLETGGERVEGPSASITMFSAVLSLLSGTSIRGVATGAISPTLLDVSVGGVDEKYRAAATAAEGVFVYPLGNMDEMAGRSNAEPAATALEAYYKLSGVDEGYIGARVEVPPGASKVFAESARSDLSSIESVDRGLLRSAGAEAAVGMAREALRAGKMYAAASLAFTAKIKVLLANVSQGLEGLPDPRSYAERLVEEASRALEEALSIYNGTNATGLWGFEAEAAAAYRLYVAEKYLERARTSLDAGDYASAAGNATLSAARAETAVVWLKVSRVGGPGITPEFQDLLARSALDLAETTLAYVSAIIRQAVSEVLGGSPEIYLSEFREMLGEAKDAYGRGDYRMALGLALELISRLAGWAEAPIYEGSKEILALYSRGLASVVETLYALAMLRGYRPLQASLYYEYGSFLVEKGNYTSGIALLGMSSCELLVLRYAMVRLAASSVPGEAAAGSPEAGKLATLASALALAVSSIAVLTVLLKAVGGGRGSSSLRCWRPARWVRALPRFIQNLNNRAGDKCLKLSLLFMEDGSRGAFNGDPPCQEPG